MGHDVRYDIGLFHIWCTTLFYKWYTSALYMWVICGLRELVARGYWVREWCKTRLWLYWHTRHDNRDCPTHKTSSLLTRLACIDTQDNHSIHTHDTHDNHSFDTQGPHSTDSLTVCLEQVNTPHLSHTRTYTHIHIHTRYTHTRTHTYTHTHTHIHFL